MSETTKGLTEQDIKYLTKMLEKKRRKCMKNENHAGMRRTGELIEKLTTGHVMVNLASPVSVEHDEERDEESTRRRWPQVVVRLHAKAPVTTRELLVSVDPLLLESEDDGDRWTIHALDKAFLALYDELGASDFQRENSNLDNRNPYVRDADVEEIEDECDFYLILEGAGNENPRVSIEAGTRV
jgi:hypothetical protein